MCCVFGPINWYLVDDTGDDEEQKPDQAINPSGDPGIRLPEFSFPPRENDKNIVTTTAKDQDHWGRRSSVYKDGQPGPSGQNTSGVNSSGKSLFPTLGGSQAKSGERSRLRKPRKDKESSNAWGDGIFSPGRFLTGRGGVQDSLSRSQAGNGTPRIGSLNRTGLPVSGEDGEFSDLSPTCNQIPTFSAFGNLLSTVSPLEALSQGYDEEDDDDDDVAGPSNTSQNHRLVYPNSGRRHGNSRSNQHGLRRTRSLDGMNLTREEYLARELERSREPRDVFQNWDAGPSVHFPQRLSDIIEVEERTELSQLSEQSQAQGQSAGTAGAASAGTEGSELPRIDEEPEQSQAQGQWANHDGAASSFMDRPTLTLRESSFTDGPGLPRRDEEAEYAEARRQWAEFDGPELPHRDGEEERQELLQASQQPGKSEVTQGAASVLPPAEAST